MAWAHPRSRGENDANVHGVRTIKGSSPLTRGKLNPIHYDELAGGLIPAHAGKTRVWGFISRIWRAHPRSRGENMRKDTRHASGTGSSPLTRGKRVHDTRARLILRLIPAHAGKTKIAVYSPFNPEAHPRSRGENSVHDRNPFLGLGSSPLTRGKPHRSRSRRGCGGLIPAHAGKTVFRWCAPRGAGAHPRSRGENTS